MVSALATGRRYSYWLGLLATPFPMFGVCSLSLLATAPSSHRWQTALCASTGYLVIAAYLGVAASMVLPGHIVVGMDRSRDIMEPLVGDVRGGAAYAGSDRATDPMRCQAMCQRVAEDRLAYLRHWLMIILGGLVPVTVGLALSAQSSGRELSAG